MKVKQVLNRFYVHDIDRSIEFYEKALNEKCKLRFKYSHINLELAQVGNILIISGSDEALKPIKDTQATFLVDSIIEFKDFLLSNGAIIIRDLKEVPTGMNMTVQHLDGTIVEYVEHKN
ncbi:VOC family protein [Clostridium aciditolerans]|uniref:VOC family protein n=1 Tax=Clostridium aciditolerans TaxID=339861 RepID=A0A934HYP4_9CLOT|nr:VOC family protein [Clostridium aciditolerans]MBI6873487.1 VOC family protein [Clostridium aciditolerans]